MNEGPNGPNLEYIVSITLIYMGDTLVNIAELVSACIALAQQAGDLIKRVHSSGDLQVQIKGFTATGVEDPLTQADIKSQILIVDGLLAHWPALRIVAEEDRVEHQPPSSRVPLDRLKDVVIPEALSKVPLSDITVFIDPLDATREFTKGHVECVMTLIGITVKKNPIAGIMFQPFVDSGVTIYGIVGSGVWGIVPSSAHKGIIVATTASHNSPAVEHALEKVKPDLVLRVGGAGYKALLVLEHKADAYIYPTDGCKLWDTCAPHAILLACGGNMTDSTGTEIVYDENIDVHVRKGVLATRKDHAKYVELINTK